MINSQAALQVPKLPLTVRLQCVSRDHHRFLVRHPTLEPRVSSWDICHKRSNSRSIVAFSIEPHAEYHDGTVCISGSRVRSIGSAGDVGEMQAASIQLQG